MIREKLGTFTVSYLAHDTPFRHCTLLSDAIQKWKLEWGCVHAPVEVEEDKVVFDFNWEWLKFVTYSMYRKD
jgi:hypothetical protein